MNRVEVTEPEKEKIYSWLRDFNHQENGEFFRSLEKEGAEVPIFISTKGTDGDVIGGLEGLLIHKWLRIDIMAVDPSHRRKGIGTELVSRAEKLALEHGCEHAFVDTMSYQAPDFYQRLGYTQSGFIPNWDSHGHDKYYFTKTLV